MSCDLAHIERLKAPRCPLSGDRWQILNDRSGREAVARLCSVERQLLRIGDLRADRQESTQLATLPKPEFEAISRRSREETMLTGGLIGKVVVAASLAIVNMPATSAVPVCRPSLSGWDAVRIDRSSGVNALVLYGHQTSPTWNGTPVTAANVRAYLSVTTQMTPQPVFVLLVSPMVDCRELDDYRRMANEILKCGPGKCVEDHF